MLTADGGSLRDPSGRVYVFRDRGGEQRVVRGLTAASAATVERLLAEPFFRRMRDDGDVAHTRFLRPDNPVATAVTDHGWASAVEHVPVEFLTWPYEWPFSMLKDAALLQLRLLETCVQSGWMLKDATPFNIQWVGTRPVFVDIPSFVPRQDGEYWQGYRQFCSLFLIPLMLTAHLRIPYQPLLRSNLEGIPPEEATRYFQGLRRLKKGVPSHVWFPARVDAWMRRRGAGQWSASGRRQPTTTLLALLDNLRPPRESAGLFSSKSVGVGRATPRRTRTKPVTSNGRWPSSRRTPQRRAHACCGISARTLACFLASRARHSDTVVAVDGDHDAVDVLYRDARGGGGRNIIPLVMNLANPSPGQGWAGRERRRV